MPEPLERLVAEDRLKEIPGVGNAIADIVTKLHKTGCSPSAPLAANAGGWNERRTKTRASRYIAALRGRVAEASR
jgi:hypothetical protein